MIKYTLGCHKSHEFEGWFANAAEYERLYGTGHLSCPQCGSEKIEKLLMAPAVKSTKGKETIESRHDQTASQMKSVDGGNPSDVSTKSPMPVASPASMPAIPAEVQVEITRQLRAFRKAVLENAENVGDNFGSEARKIHFGESEQRGIYGTTSKEEAAELLEEGIEIMPLPVLPENQN